MACCAYKAVAKMAGVWIQLCFTSGPRHENTLAGAFGIPAFFFQIFISRHQPLSVRCGRFPIVGDPHVPIDNHLFVVATRERLDTGGSSWVVMRLCWLSLELMLLLVGIFPCRWKSRYPCRSPNLVRLPRLPRHIEGPREATKLVPPSLLLVVAIVDATVDGVCAAAILPPRSLHSSRIALVRPDPSYTIRVDSGPRIPPPTLARPRDVRRTDEWSGPRVGPSTGHLWLSLLLSWC
mmetsp:Transcript_21732/g.45383  ORF Transcript_21732/g.45383 Transcript_21732/m.45383 type:complete len:236 (+) Transcript_21732:1281-1988(+)